MTAGGLTWDMGDSGGVDVEMGDSGGGGGGQRLTWEMGDSCVREGRTCGGLLIMAVIFSV